jgi:hypothetical protein
MNQTPQQSQSPSAEPSTWAAPAYEVIALDCEITAYAPDGDFPLF